MMAAKKTIEGGNDDFAAKQDNQPTPRYARDLIDFHLRWAEFRPVATSLLGLPDLTRSQIDTLNWLIALADRVSDDDLR
jgi:hypothetical protein